MLSDTYSPFKYRTCSVIKCLLYMFFREQNEFVFSKITIFDEFLLKIEMNDAYDGTTELCDLWNQKQEVVNEMEKL